MRSPCRNAVRCASAVQVPRLLPSPAVPDEIDPFGL